MANSPTVSRRMSIFSTAIRRIWTDRTIEMFDPAGGVLSSVTYMNGFAAGLRNPRSTGWNVEFDRQVTSALLFPRGISGAEHNSGFRPHAGNEYWMLSLSNGGRLLYREFQVTGQYKIPRATLNVSFVRSKTYGDLNDFNQFFGNNAVAVIQPDERGRLPFDAPTRFLAWGQWEAPFKLRISAGLGYPHRISIFRRRSGTRVRRASGLIAIPSIHFL